MVGSFAMSAGPRSLELVEDLHVGPFTGLARFFRLVEYSGFFRGIFRPEEIGFFRPKWKKLEETQESLTTILYVYALTKLQCIKSHRP